MGTLSPPPRAAFARFQRLRCPVRRERSDRFANYGATDLHRINQLSLTRELITDAKLVLTNEGSNPMHRLLDSSYQTRRAACPLTHLWIATLTSSLYRHLSFLA